MNEPNEMFDINILRGRTYATIRGAFNKSDEIMFENGDVGNANITSILTFLIRECGRFTERFASDALYTMDHLRDIARKKCDFDEPFDEIFIFGIRQDGVDGENYIMKNLADSRRSLNDYVYASHTYRKIYAVRARVFREKGLYSPRCEFSLRDLSHSFLTLDSADLCEDGYKVNFFTTDNKISREPSEERLQVDKVDIKRAKEAGYKRFSLLDVARETLEKEGSTGDMACMELQAYWDNPIIPPADDKGHPICRIYGVGEIAIVVWLDKWYEHYNNVTDLIAYAKDYLKRGG